MRRLVAVVSLVLLAGFAPAQASTLENARTQMQQKNYAAARATLEAIVAKEPLNGPALIELARCTRELGDFGASIDAANRALAIPFQPRIARFELARTLAREGDRDGAIAQIDAIAAMGANKGLHDRVASAPEFEAYRGSAAFDAVVAKLVPCGSPEYRQFDFWLGNWEVRDPAGNVVGRNDVTLHLDGCMLMESWTSAAGHAGMSMNYYDPADATWNQVFLDNSGSPSNWPPLKGKLLDGKMVLTSPDGVKPKARWTWSKTGDGRVRQMAEQLNDDGTWAVTWDSYYGKAK